MSPCQLPCSSCVCSLSGFLSLSVCAFALSPFDISNFTPIYWTCQAFFQTFFKFYIYRSPTKTYRLPCQDLFFCAVCGKIAASNGCSFFKSTHFAISQVPHVKTVRSSMFYEHYKGVALARQPLFASFLKFFYQRMMICLIIRWSFTS